MRFERRPVTLKEVTDQSGANLSPRTTYVPTTRSSTTYLSALRRDFSYTYRPFTKRAAILFLEALQEQPWPELLAAEDVDRKVGIFQGTKVLGSGGYLPGIGKPCCPMAIGTANEHLQQDQRDGLVARRLENRICCADTEETYARDL